MRIRLYECKITMRNLKKNILWRTVIIINFEIINWYRMKTKKGIWLSYDFGLKADYTGLFTWLDNKNAVECGNSMAFFLYEFDDATLSANPKSLVESLSSEINEYVKLAKNDRIYVVWKEPVSQKMKGDFINGSRKHSPWEGFGQRKAEAVSDSE
jgi:hypothetical protein